MDNPSVEAAVASAWREGQGVVITRGVLAGLTGALMRGEGDEHRLLALDCLPRGVFLRIDARALKQRTESIAEGTPGIPATCPAPPQREDD